MPRTKLDPNHPFVAAQLYCEHFLGRPLNPRVDGRILADARRQIEAAQSLGSDAQGMFACLLNLSSGESEFTWYEPYEKFARDHHYPTPVAFCVLGWSPILPSGQKRTDVTILQAYLEIPEPPPVYDRLAYAEWVLQWGHKALRQGCWDGVYLYALVTSPEDDRLTPQELELMFGHVAATRAVEAWKQERLARRMPL